HDRFVGDYVLYGTENGSVVTAVPWRGGDLTQVAMDHGTDRIEQIGFQAMVIGGSGVDLRFTGIQLGAGGPRVAAQLTIPDAAQGELRSHWFFYRPDGTIGLPIRPSDSPRYAHLFKGSAGVVFLHYGGGRFTQLGMLVAGDSLHQNDACRASCVDWYSN